MGSVEKESYDIQSGLASTWAICFSVLYLMVMVLSVLLYLALVRALATSPRTSCVTYHLVLLLFFTALVEFAVLIEELMNSFGVSLHTTANCQLLQYTVFGNRLLQAATMLTMLYSNTLAVYLKTCRAEVCLRRWFPLLVALLLLLELATCLPPALGVRASLAGQWCEHRSQESSSLEGWVHGSLLPYWVPLVASLPPCVYLGLRLRRAQVLEPRQSQVTPATPSLPPAPPPGEGKSGSVWILLPVPPAVPPAPGDHQGGGEQGGQGQVEQALR